MTCRAHLRVSRALHRRGSLTRRYLSVVAVALLLSAPPFVVAADVPMLLNYQGNLVAPDGTPKSGQYSIEFAVYDAVSDGNQLPAAGPWGETQSVQVADCVFNVLLGSVTSLPPTPFDGGPSDSAGPLRFLEVVVEGETLSPRHRIVSVAYALRFSTTGATAPNTHSVSLNGGGSLGVSDTPQHPLDLAGSDLTFEMWVYIDGQPARYALLQKGNCDGNNNTYYLDYNDRIIRLVVSEATHGSQEATWSVDHILDHWRHVAVTFSDALDEVKLYVDGHKVGTTQPITLSIEDSEEPFMIGAAHPSCGGLSGVVGNAYAALAAPSAGLSDTGDWTMTWPT